MQSHKQDIEDEGWMHQQNPRTSPQRRPGGRGRAQAVAGPEATRPLKGHHHVSVTLSNDSSIVTLRDVW